MSRTLLPPPSAPVDEGIGPAGLPMSPMQQAMLYGTLQAPESGINIEQILVQLGPDLDQAALAKAVQSLPAAFLALRMAFAWAPTPTLLVSEESQLSLEVHPLLDSTAESREEFLVHDRRRGFALEHAPLARCTLLTGGNTPELVWTFHHALLDGRSFAPVLQLLFTRYEALRAGGAPPIAPPDRLGAYLGWQAKLDFAESRSFWRETFAEFEKPAPLRAPWPITPISGPLFVECSTVGLSHCCALVAERLGVTTHTLVQGAWALLLSHYIQAEEVVFGSVRACRRSAFPQAAEVVGLLINTVPLRVALPLQAGLAEWLQSLRAQHLAIRPHEQTPLHLIQEWGGQPTSEPLFESLLAFENHELDEVLRKVDSGWHHRPTELREHPGFPLTLNVVATEHLRVRLSYDGTRFKQDFAHSILAHFHVLLQNLLTAEAATTLRTVPMLAPEESRHLLQQGQTKFTEDPSRSLTRWFEEQARATPDAVALSADEGVLTYGELNAQANGLARQLQAAGMGQGTLVAICLPRSSRAVVAMLGVLKAGAGYVPLEPDLPSERLAYILDDTRATVLLADVSLQAAVPVDTVQVWVHGRDWGTATSTHETNLEEAPGMGATAYVIYTSGSTGQPKGVPVAHRQVARLMESTETWFHFGPTDVWTFFHSFAFDFSVWEIWGALLYGGRLVIVPHLISRAPDAFYELLRREQVTVLNQTPSAFRQLMAVDEAASERAPLALRTVIFGGEALDPRMLRGWFARHGDAQPQLVNMYGITETTVHVTYRPLRAADAESASSIIGEPLPDLALHVVDRFGQPCPLGVAGELQVGGAGVTSGYLHRPELTAERFIPDSFSVDPPGRLYRTGDLVRRLPGGELEYLGRSDSQVKIRGHRIEPGEVEKCLCTHSLVHEAVVLAREGRLLAYLLTPAQQPSADELRALLRRTLPEYMVPATFTCLAQWPLTGNGKLDRHRLPDPSSSPTPPPSQRSRTAQEQAIAQAWCEVLVVSQVEVDRNFFDCGGDSLRLLQVWARLKATIAPGLPVVALFAHPTVADLARHLTPTGPSPSAAGPAARRQAMERNQRALRQRTHL